MDSSIQLVKSFVSDLSFEKVKEKADSCPYNFKVTENDNLYMISYTEKSRLDLLVVRAMNGVIFEKGTNKLIHFSFQKSYEGLFSEFADNHKDAYRGEHLESYITEVSIEGTHIKLFYYDGKWNISTARSINAALSFWNNNKSFKELFLECVAHLGFDFDNLDKNLCYSYIFQHPENKICGIVNDYYISVLNSVNVETDEILRGTSNLIVNGSLDNVLNALENPEHEFNYIVYLDDGRRIKLVNKKFKEKQNLVKNDQDMRRVYLKCIVSGTSDRLKELFPEFRETFRGIDIAITNTVKDIHQIYMNKFVHKSDEEVYSKFEKTLKQLHWGYRKTREKVTRDKVYDILINLNCKILIDILDL
jgi:hypothetical protein